jgi:hypothetical protein
MARISGVGNNLLDSILPTYGNPRVKTPIWNESQHMFITDQYTSAAGNTYYLGVRFTDRFVTILHIGLYYSWTYINEVEVYAFDGHERRLVGKTSIDQFYNEELVRSTTENLLHDYIEGQMKLNGCTINHEQLECQVKELVQKSYFSLLNDANVAKKLEAVKPLLLPNK